MTIRFNKTRRDILRYSMALGCFGFASSSLDAKVQSLENVSIDPVAKILCSVISERASANMIGRQYLRDAPEEADISILVDSLCRHQSGAYLQFLRADSATVRQMILNQQREDFGQGRTLSVEGWILSETEIRLCALSALMATVGA